MSSVSYQDQSGSGGIGGHGSQYRIPDELQEILLDFTVNYLIEQPSDIARWEYFLNILKNQLQNQWVISHNLFSKRTKKVLRC